MAHRHHLRIQILKLRQIRASDIILAVQKELMTGKIPQGLYLPPVRLLSRQYGISKNTVQSAYSEMAARGWVESRHRSGHLIRGISDPQFLPAKTLQRRASPLDFQEGAFPPAIHLKAKGSEPIPLGSVFIDLALLPMRQIEKCFRSVLKSPGLHYLYDNQGYLPLRKAIAKRLSAQGISAHPDHIVLTTGSQQALDIAVRSLRKKSIATENPAYGLGKLLFEMNQMKVTGLPLDPFQGLDLNLWRKIISVHRPSALYLTTNFHNPTGYSYSSSELENILEISQEHGVGLIEDDWGSEMLSAPERKDCLRTLGGENVIYINSFTKKLLPSLRLGYLLANEKTMPALLAAKRVGTIGNPTLIEAALFEFLDRGYFDTHLAKLHLALDERYESCLKNLEELMPPEVKWTFPGGGPVLWLELPKTIHLGSLADCTRKKGFSLDLRTRDWFFGEPHLHGVKIGYAQISSEEMRRGLEVLSGEIRKMMVKSLA